MIPQRPLVMTRVFVAVIVFVVITVVIALFATVEDTQLSILRRGSLKNYEYAADIYAGRRREIAKVCHLYPELRRPFNAKTVSKMIVDPIHRIMFCPAGKAASTFWKQILEVSSGIFNNSNPLEIYDEDYRKLYYLSKLNTVPQKVATRCFKSFFFTRHPFSRILSAYNDKLFMTNFYYWKAWGKKIIKKFRPNATNASKECGHDVTFAEFIKFLIFVFETNHPSATDTHVSPVSSQCKPCTVNYTYVGKLETLVKDVQVLLPVLGMEKKIVFNDLKQAYERQSIADLVHRNINWHNRYPDINKCITQSDLVRRLWQYSLNVGHIHFNSKPPDRLLGRSNVTVEELTRALMKVRPLPGLKLEVKKFKESAMRKQYASVSSKDMKKLISIYRLDFEMFGYDPVI